MYGELFLSLVSVLALISPAFAEDGTWRVMLTGQGVREIAITGDTVYSTNGQEIFRFEKKDGTINIITNPYTDTHFESIATADDGTLFASTLHTDQDPYSRYSYLLRYDGTSWTTLHKRDADNISNLVTDHRNGIWGRTIGWGQTGGHELRFDRSSGEKLIDISRKPYFDSIVIADSLVWFSGYDFLYCVPESLWCCLKKIEQLASYKKPFPGLWGGVPDSSGHLWFGYTGETEWGLVEFDGKNWVKKGLTDQFRGITTVAIDNRNVVWATTSRGLGRFDGTAWTFQIGDLPDYHFTDVEVDRDGVVWIGSGEGIVSFTYNTLTAVKEQTPAAFRILANYPNPFNPSTAISFTIPETGPINLSVYDIIGRKVRELVSGSLDAGIHTTRWDGRDADGKQVSSGIYIARLTMGKITAQRKMLLIR